MPSKTAPIRRSIKHDIIDRDSTRIVAVVAAAVFVVVFCSFAIKTLVSQSLYQNRVVSEKEKTLKQLKKNKESLKTLEQSYTAFVNESENILGGNPTGQGPIDGNNAKIVLDALPGKYDYPALSSSFEKILREGGYTIVQLGGTEQENSEPSATAKATPIEVPYTFGFSSDANKAKALLQTLERSIRPMNVDTLRIQVANGGQVTATVGLHTYYTQQKTFELGSEVVK